MQRRFNIVVAIATTGRPYVLLETLREMRKQTRLPDAVYVCPASEKDVYPDQIAELGLPVRYSNGSRGASAQRNAILADIPEADIVMFLDDDFVMADDYLSEVEQLFIEQPEVVLTTGVLLADDVNGPGMTLEAAQALIAASGRPEVRSTETKFNGYGCNMAVRWASLAGKCIRFDERLPLYSWGEDVDFSRQAASYGTIVKCNRLRGVHRAVKGGRTNGLRFGYSQIANQLYFVQKGTVSGRVALLYALKNVLANMSKAIRPEPFIDRRGRLLGNWKGFVDVLLGRSYPERILEL